MSAPDTNIETQKSQHRTPLVGMRLAMIFALALLLLFIGWVWLRTDGPEGANAQVDGRTGAVIQVQD